MKKVGLAKARARLSDAFKAHEELKSAENWSEFESAWTALISALHSTYTILEQASKGNQTSERWFLDIKAIRKADEALSYLHHARNANEHGIREILTQQPGGIGIGGRGQNIYIESLTLGSDGLAFRGHSLDGSPVKITHIPGKTFLIPVWDRGREYPVPKTFLGEILGDVSPFDLATKILEYVTYFFVDAEELLLNNSDN